MTFAIASPAGVVVSTAQSSATSAQDCFWALAMSPAKSIPGRSDPVHLRDTLTRKRNFAALVGTGSRRLIRSHRRL